MEALSPNGPLLEPLLLRALASRKLRTMEFVDLAAEALLPKLGLNDRQIQSMHRKMGADQRSLLCCKWIDDRLLEILTRQADACVIEFGSALSTRFHRVSARLDWPRCQWLSLDSAEAVKLGQSLLPETDNLELLCWDYDADAWQSLVRKVGNRPLVMVSEHARVTEAMHWWSLLEFLQPLHDNDPQMLMPMKKRQQFALEQRFGEHFRVLNELALCRAGSGWFDALRAAYSRLETHNLTHFSLRLSTQLPIAG